MLTRSRFPQALLRGLGALVVALALVAPAVASERHPTLVELEGEVICPTCHTTLDQSNSLEARRIELFISKRIAAGDTKSEIKATLVAQFGTAVLAAPPRRGFDLLAWWLPIGGILAAGVILAIAAWRWSHLRERAGNEPETAAAQLDPELERKLEEELARY